MFLVEGGNAIQSATAILSVKAELFGNLIVKKIKEQLHVNACTLGSTGKKLDTDYSGDIDIAIEMPWTNESLHNVREFIKSNFGSVEAYSSAGLKIYSFGYKYDDMGEIKTVQVDLMFTSDIHYAQFMYHSPNYKNQESKFKGLYRTNLLVIVANNTPVPDAGLKTEYFTDLDFNGSCTGEVKSFWKYTLSYEEGLKIVHKSYVGIKKPLKNPQTVKSDTIIVTKDINKILKIILGPDATVANCNSFESVVDYLCEHKSKIELDKIFDEFLSDDRHKPMYDECEEYIYTSMKKHGKI